MPVNMTYQYSDIWSEPLPRMVGNIEAWMTEKEGKKLQELIKGKDRYLEIGTYQGFSAKLASEVVSFVVTIDKEINPQIRQLINETDNILYLKGLSEKVVRDVTDNSLDVLFIDGCHFIPNIRLDYSLYLPKVKDRGLIIFHDYNIRNEVTQVVDEINILDYKLQGTFESLAWFIKGVVSESKK